MASTDDTSSSPYTQALEQSNAYFDRLFYDIGVLTEQEMVQLSPLHHVEGTFVLVSPQEGIQHYPSLEEFMAARDTSGQALSEKIKSIAIAGVGSSVFGTAALARNVANTYQQEVLGIISGVGLSDFVEEGLEGWFFYGISDKLRRFYREYLNMCQQMMAQNPLLSLSSKRAAFSLLRSFKEDPQPDIKDIEALEKILNENLLPNLNLLVGHSKGALLIDFAAERLTDGNSPYKETYFEKLHLITFGAVLDLPPKFKNRQQFIGALDWFGGLNSRPDVDHKTIPGAWHHTNTQMPFSMPVEEVLKTYVNPEN